MINSGYTVSAEDTITLSSFKESEAYSTYLKSIASSPAFISVMNEHITNIDISDDINKLKSQGKIQENIDSKSMNDIFKRTVEKMAICIVADTIIIREIEDNKIEEVLQNIKDDSDITYLMGLADEKYYKQAAGMVEKGKLDKNSLAFKGLVTYIKRNKKWKSTLDTIKTEPVITKKKKPKKIENNKQKIDINSDNIEL